jgi:hypothetical protein
VRQQFAQIAHADQRTAHRAIRSRPGFVTYDLIFKRDAFGSQRITIRGAAPTANAMRR